MFIIKDPSRIMRRTVRAACTVRLLFRLRNFFQEPDNKHFSHWIINSFSRATRREYDVKSTSLVCTIRESFSFFYYLFIVFFFFNEKYRLNVAFFSSSEIRSYRWQLINFSHALLAFIICGHGSRSIDFNCARFTSRKSMCHF